MRRRPLTIVAAAAVVGLAVGSGAGPPPGRNHLGDEKSLYLRQHTASPIWWWTWSPEALAEARRQDKPIFLSIGYSSCHWCHVMERESFEREDVVRILNASFVAIAVDREERPDLDALYLHAVEAMTGRGGWPMTVLLTPDGRPFAGATYLPPGDLLKLLRRSAAAWNRDRRGIEARGARISRALAAERRREAAGPLGEDLLDRFEKAVERSFDWKHGGLAGAPKFPPAFLVRLLLRIHRRSADPKSLEMVTRTLDAMARGGIRDQLGGGFHRYAVDERWIVPHFEKMLYDQAELAQAYLEGYQATGDEAYARVVRGVLDDVLAHLTGAEGGFFSAEDADSGGEEGAFYLWRKAELARLLEPAEFAAVEEAYGITEKGDLPNGANVLHLVRGEPGAASGVLARALAKMKRARDRRVRPRRDEKVLTDWNGLMIAAMAKAGRVLREPRYLEAAARSARFVLARLGRPDGTLLHRESGGEARYPGNLDDYAFLADGLIELYEADFAPHWLDQAVRLGRQIDGRFRAPRGDDYFTDGSDSSLLLREVRRIDDVTPAGNSVAALDGLRLADLTLDPEAGRRARAILAATPKQVEGLPQAFPALLMAVDYATDRSKEIAIVGDPDDPDTRALASAVRSGFTPNLVVAVGGPGAEAVPLLRGKPLRNGRPTAYVCENQVCQAPTNDPKTAAALAHTFRPLDR